MSLSLIHTKVYFFLILISSQLFYYESISVEGHVSLSHAVPCLSSWGEDEITEREKRERELGGYGCGEVLFSFVMFDTKAILYIWGYHTFCSFAGGL